MKLYLSHLNLVLTLSGILNWHYCKRYSWHFLWELASYEFQSGLLSKWSTGFFPWATIFSFCKGRGRLIHIEKLHCNEILHWTRPIRRRRSYLHEPEAPIYPDRICIMTPRSFHFELFNLDSQSEVEKRTPTEWWGAPHSEPWICVSGSIRVIQTFGPFVRLLRICVSGPFVRLLRRGGEN